MMALRMDNWKMIVKNGKVSLYNLATDLHEDHDVAGDNPKIVDRMTAIIRREHTTSSMFKITLPGESEKR